MAARALTLVLGEDNHIWASDPLTGIGYRMSPPDSLNQHPPVAGAGGGSAPSGIPEAPTDGKIYGRESAAWTPVPAALPLSGGTLTGALTVQGDQFDVNIGAGNPALIFKSSQNTAGFRIGANGDLEVTGARGGIHVNFPGGLQAYAPPDGRIAVDATEGIRVILPGGSAAVVYGSTGGGGANANIRTINGDLQLQNWAGDKSIHLYIDQTTGDLVVTQPAGPNAGKSVNLTAGHWV